MKKVTAVVARILEYMVGTLFMIIAATALAQVFSRYVLRHSLVWAHELDILLMIWAVWLGTVIGIHRKAHLRITLVSERLSVKTRRILLIFIDLFTLLFLLIVGIKGIEVIQSVEGMDLISMPIPRGVMFAAAPVSAVLMILLFIPIIVGDLRDLTIQKIEKRRG
ncbi:MAG: TRAP transporter small permease [Deltaproteobacteria bacterium]|nr:TRAP transporter small permease [Deltaproteobacteria bacterium]